MVSAVVYVVERQVDYLGIGEVGMALAYVGVPASRFWFMVGAIHSAVSFGFQIVGCLGGVREAAADDWRVIYDAV